MGIRYGFTADSTLSLQTQQDWVGLLIDEATSTEDQKRILRAIERLKLDRTVVQTLIGKLNRIAPLDLLSAIEAVARLRDDSIDRQLLEALPNNPASKTLMIESVTELFKDRSAEVQELVQRRWSL